MIRNQLRTTSAALIGAPSLNVIPGRRWKTTVAPPSRNSHDDARAGRVWSCASMAVRLSNSWAEIAALPISPWVAGSRLSAGPMRIRTVSASAARTDGAPTGGANGPTSGARIAMSTAAAATRTGRALPRRIIRSGASTTPPWVRGRASRAGASRSRARPRRAHAGGPRGHSRLQRSQRGERRCRPSGAWPEYRGGSADRRRRTAGKEKRPRKTHRRGNDALPRGLYPENEAASETLGRFDGESHCPDERPGEPR